MPDKQAARNTDMHTCPSSEPGPTPHVGGPIMTGSAELSIEDLPAARAKVDYAQCVAGGPDYIAQGAEDVYVDDQLAARLECKTQHNGVITGHASEVVIGGATVTVLRIKERHGDETAGSKDDEAQGNSSEDPNVSNAEDEDSNKDAENSASSTGSCQITGLVVTCGHTRTAGAGGVLQVVGSALTTSVSVNLPSPTHASGVLDPGVSYSVTNGGRDKVTLSLVNTEECAGPHATSITTQELGRSASWFAGNDHTYELAWSGEEPRWQSNVPQVYYGRGRRCDGSELECRIEMYQPTQVSAKLSATGIGERIKKSDFADVAKAMRRFASPVVVDGPTLKDAVGEVSLKWGWREVPDDWRVQWYMQGAGTVKVGLNLGSVSVNILAIAGTFFAIPPQITSFLTDYSIRLDLVVSAGFDMSFGLGELSVTRYSDGSFGAGVGVGLLAGADVSVGLAVRIGLEWIQRCSIEVGGRAGVEFNGTVTVNDRGVFGTCEGKLRPVRAYVKIVKRGWFSNDTAEGATDLFTCGEPVGFRDYPLLEW